MRSLSEYHHSKTHPALLQAIDDAARLGIPDQAYQAFHSQFDSARRRGIEFMFTLEAWWVWWQTFDEQHGCVRWARRGMGRTALVMARFGDIGPYSPENVYCATHSQNTKDYCTRDPERMARQAQKWHDTHDCWLRGRRGDAHPKSRAIITHDGRFGSAALAAEHYGITRAGAKHRADRQIDGWRWEQP